MDSYFDAEDDKIEGGSDNDNDDDISSSSSSSHEDEHNEHNENNEHNEEEMDEEEIDEDEDLEDEDDYDKQMGGAEEEDAEEEEGVDEEEVDKKTKKTKKIPTKNVYKKPIDFVDDDDDDDIDGEQYLQKFEQSVSDDYIVNFHPECVLQNYDEILSMTKVVRNSDGIIIDKLHRTIPYLTKYEKARILGQRAKQINSGAHAFIKVPENVIDGYIIAEMELKQKRIPLIIRRPLPNGGSEYWKVQDLEDISF
jgi:DNA-directed RNA polymerase I, II, and III subunit RPABC2